MNQQPETPKKRRKRWITMPRLSYHLRYCSDVWRYFCSVRTCLFLRLYACMTSPSHTFYFSFHVMSLTIIFAYHLLVDTKHLQEFFGVLPILKFEGKNRVCVSLAEMLLLLFCILALAIGVQRCCVSVRRWDQKDCNC